MIPPPRRRRRRRSIDITLPFCPALKKPRSLRFPPPRFPPTRFPNPQSPPPRAPLSPAVKSPTLRLFKMGNLSSTFRSPRRPKSKSKSKLGITSVKGLLDVLSCGWDDGAVYVVNRKRAAVGLFKAKAVGEPFEPLTDEEEDMVAHAMGYGKRHQVLVTHTGSNIEITREVLQCLSSCAWLNDEVINVYLELLKERENREPKKFLKCHFFNTFFYKKLISGQTGYDFKSVRRWTSKKKLGYELIECDKIFVPIHKGTHWCLAVINVNDENFQYLDSLGGMDSSVLQALATYFRDEANDKSERQIDTKSWKQETINGLPLQKNGYDCGMFMLKYIDFFSRGLSLSFRQEHMPYFRKRTAKEILLLKAE